MQYDHCEVYKAPPLRFFRCVAHPVLIIGLIHPTKPFRPHDQPDLHVRRHREDSQSPVRATAASVLLFPFKAAIVEAFYFDSSTLTYLVSSLVELLGCPRRPSLSLDCPRRLDLSPDHPRNPFLLHRVL